MFNILAEDRFEARDLLDKWLSYPAQTGYKYSRCVGIVPEASKFVLINQDYPVAKAAVGNVASDTICVERDSLVEGLTQMANVQYLDKQNTILGICSTILARKVINVESKADVVRNVVQEFSDLAKKTFSTDTHNAIDYIAKSILEKNNV